MAPSTETSRAECASDERGAVGRAVIADDSSGQLVRLRLNRAQQYRQVLLLVPYRNDDPEFRS